MIRPTTRRRFTAAEYHAMARAGILHEDDRVELIEGEVVEMAAIGSRHAACVNRINDLLVTALHRRAVVAVQNPVRLGELSEPQPDLAVLRLRDDFYAGSHPRPDDVFLLIEVAESSLPYEREVKLPLYARFGIREVWLVDLDAAAVEVLREPAPGSFGSWRSYRAGETIAPAAFPDLEVDPAELLPGSGSPPA